MGNLCHGDSVESITYMDPRRAERDVGRWSDGGPREKELAAIFRINSSLKSFLSKTSKYLRDIFIVDDSKLICA